jgi:hypothetical protein
MHDEEVIVQVPDLSYDPLVGAQPDGSWRAASVAMFERVCTIILESEQEGEFNEPVARMLTRWVSLLSGQLPLQCAAVWVYRI